MQLKMDISKISYFRISKYLYGFYLDFLEGDGISEWLVTPQSEQIERAILLQNASRVSSI